MNEPLVPVILVVDDNEDSIRISAHASIAAPRLDC